MLCFVIMPFGGTEEAKRSHFLGVYNQILKAAAIEAGFAPSEVKRSDIAAVPGNIVQDIVRDLYEADIVLADLTEGNPNVFWELGVRNALRKSGTVTVIDAEHILPFDISTYRTITYSTRDLGRISSVVAEIAESIRKRLDNPAKSDNAVHDILPELPISFASIERDDALGILQDRVKELTQENEALSTRLKKIDPAGVLLDFEDNSLTPAQRIQEATSIFEKAGPNLLLRLAEAQEDREQFIAELLKAVENPYLSTSDYLQIGNMCRTIGLETHRRAVLEIAVKAFPYSESVKLALVAAYDDADSFPLQERGRQIIEEIIGIEHGEHGPELTRRATAGQHEVGLLFNFYLTRRQYDWIISVAESFEKQDIVNVLLVRNKAMAMGKVGRNDEADREFKRAIELYPEDDTTYLWFGDFLDDLGQFEPAYEMTERALLTDPEDATRYIALGNQILMRGYTRDETGRVISGLKRKERLAYAMPLFIRAIQVSQHPSIVNRVVQILINENAVKEAAALQRGNIPAGDFVSSALDYVDACLADSQQETLADV